MKGQNKPRKGNGQRYHGRLTMFVRPVSVETTASMSIKGSGSVTPGAELC